MSSSAEVSKALSKAGELLERANKAMVGDDVIGVAIAAHQLQFEVGIMLLWLARSASEVPHRGNGGGGPDDDRGVSEASEKSAK